MKYLKHIVPILLIFALINCFSREKETLILCMGDSITESSWGNYPAAMNRIFTKRGKRFTAVSLGRPGNTSGEYLDFLSGRQDIPEKYSPGIIVIMLGTNDVRIDYDRTPVEKYRENMNAILRIIRSHEEKSRRRIRIYIATIPPIFTHDLNTFTEESSRRVEEEINPAVREIAAENGLTLIDIHGMFMKNRDLLPGIHPSPGGYYKIAVTIADVILEEGIEKARQK